MSLSTTWVSTFRKTGQVGYKSKDGLQAKVFDALEWLAAMPGAAKLCEDRCSHVPNKGEQMVRYYGLYVDPVYTEIYPP